MTVFTLTVGTPSFLAILVLNLKSPYYYYLLLCLHIAECVANSVDLNQMPHSLVSDLSLHCLLRLVSLNI